MTSTGQRYIAERVWRGKGQMPRGKVAQNDVDVAAPSRASGPCRTPAAPPSAASSSAACRPATLRSGRCRTDPVSVAPCAGMGGKRAHRAEMGLGGDGIGRRWGWAEKGLGGEGGGAERAVTSDPCQHPWCAHPGAGDSAGRWVGVEGRGGPQRWEGRSTNTQVRIYARAGMVMVMVMTMTTMMANMHTEREPIIIRLVRRTSTSPNPPQQALYPALSTTRARANPPTQPLLPRTAAREITAMGRDGGGGGRGSPNTQGGRDSQRWL